MNGIELIAKERQRQIESEGYTPERDDRYKSEELLDAAMQYIGAGLIDCWPFGEDEYKPHDTDRARDLVKAGALIAAEIDRLKRLEVKDAV